MDYKELKKQNGQRIESYRAADDGGVDFFPKYMQIEMTNRCNANCIMCNHFYYMIPKTQQHYIIERRR